MSAKRAFGMLVLALSVCGAASAQTGAPSAPASAQRSAFAPNTAAARKSNFPTAAQLNQPGAVVVAPPILRNEGRTVTTPDRPLLARLNLHTQPLQDSVIGPPPVLQPAPLEAAVTGIAARQ
jgi:hypothetical protein